MPIEIATMKTRSSTRAQTSARHATTVERHMKKTNKLRAKLKAKHGQLMNKTAECDQRGNQIVNLQNSVADLQRTNTVRGNQITGLEEKVQELRKQRSELINETSRLKASVSSLTGDNKETRAENVSLRADCSRLRQTNGNLNRELSNVSRVLEQKKAELQGMRGEYARLGEKLESVKRKNRKLTTSVDNLGKDKAMASNELTASKSIISGLVAQNGQYQVNQINNMKLISEKTLQNFDLQTQVQILTTVARKGIKMIGAYQGATAAPINLYRMSRPFVQRKDKPLTELQEETLEPVFRWNHTNVNLGRCELSFQINGRLNQPAPKPAAIKRTLNNNNVDIPTFVKDLTK